MIQCDWAVRNLDLFPVEVNKAQLRHIAKGSRNRHHICTKIVSARKVGSLGFEELKKMGVVLKSPVFHNLQRKMMLHIKFDPKFIDANLSLIKEQYPFSAITNSYPYWITLMVVIPYAEHIYLRWLISRSFDQLF